MKTFITLLISVLLIGFNGTLYADCERQCGTLFSDVGAFCKTLQDQNSRTLCNDLITTEKHTDCITKCKGLQSR